MVVIRNCIKCECDFISFIYSLIHYLLYFYLFFLSITGQAFVATRRSTLGDRDVLEASLGGRAAASLQVDSICSVEFFCYILYISLQLFNCCILLSFYYYHMDSTITTATTFTITITITMTTIK